MLFFWLLLIFDPHQKNNKFTIDRYEEIIIDGNYLRIWCTCVQVKQIEMGENRKTQFKDIWSDGHVHVATSDWYSVIYCLLPFRNPVYVLFLLHSLLWIRGLVFFCSAFFSPLVFSIQFTWTAEIASESIAKIIDFR